MTKHILKHKGELNSLCHDITQIINLLENHKRIIDNLDNKHLYRIKTNYDYCLAELELIKAILKSGLNKEEEIIESLLTENQI